MAFAKRHDPLQARGKIDFLTEFAKEPERALAKIFTGDDAAAGVSDQASKDNHRQGIIA